MESDLKTDHKFIYNKKFDQLFYNGFLIYKQGKWATRVKERVRVFLKEFNCTSDGKVTSLKMDILGKCLNDTQARLISYELENILNKEIE